MNKIEEIANMIKMARMRGEKVQIVEESGMWKIVIGRSEQSGLTKSMVDEAMNKSLDRTILG